MMVLEDFSTTYEWCDICITQFSLLIVTPLIPACTWLPIQSWCSVSTTTALSKKMRCLETAGMISMIMIPYNVFLLKYSQTTILQPGPLLGAEETQRPVPKSRTCLGFELLWSEERPQLRDHWDPKCSPRRTHRRPSFSSCSQVSSPTEERWQMLNPSWTIIAALLWCRCSLRARSLPSLQAAHFPDLPGSTVLLMEQREEWVILLQNVHLLQSCLQ